MDKQDILTKVTYFCPICKCEWDSPERAVNCRDRHASIPASIRVEFPGGYTFEYTTHDPHNRNRSYREFLAQKEKAAQ